MHEKFQWCIGFAERIWCLPLCARRRITFRLRNTSLKKPNAIALGFFVAPPAGLEPATSWLTVMRSTDWAKEEYEFLLTDVGIDLSSRSVARQVLWALQSLTSVFGMGTGGPSAFETPTGVNKNLCQHWSIFPVRRQTSIVDTAELNFCVRNGNRWTLCVWNTD